MSIVEVMIASGILSMVMLGVLQGMLQSRRQTEGSIRQGTCASLVQGYMEQIKSLKYATTLNDLPSSPSATPGVGTWPPGMPMWARRAPTTAIPLWISRIPARPP